MKKYLPKIIFALCFAAALDYYLFKFGAVREITHNLIDFLAFFFAIYIQNHQPAGNKVLKRGSLIFGLLLAFALVVGKAVYDTNMITPLYQNFFCVTISIISLIGFTKIFSSITLVIFSALIKNEKKREAKLWRFFTHPRAFLMIWLIIFICWLPCFLAYYPGLWSYDIETQTSMATFHEYTKFHPPIHTLIWDLSLRVSHHINLPATVIYELPQMLTLSFSFACLISFLIKRRVSSKIILFSLLFFALNPMFAIFSLEMTKDVYFTVFVILFLLELINLAASPKLYLAKWQNITKFIIIAILFCLFRNNAFYALVLAIPFVTLFCVEYRLKIFALFLAPAMICYLISGPLYHALGVQNGDIREALSVPMQQLTAVLIKDSNLSQDELQDINNYIDVETAKARYNPRFSDPVKNNAFNSEYVSGHKLGFIKTWFQQGIKHLDIYISSFLSLNLPDWFPDSKPVDLYSNLYYIEDGLADSEGSFLPWLRDNYYRQISTASAMTTPIISLYFSISLPIWFILFSLIYLLSRKFKYIYLPYIPLLLLFASYIVSPVSNFRFMFPFIALYPLYFALILAPTRLLTRRQ